MPPDADCLYHAAPLHYLPRIVQESALYPKSVGAARGIRPRPGAAQRDRRLGLADYIHLSLHPKTPLLADKIKLGYPHALLVFDRAHVLSLPQVALIPYNTKAWFDKAAYALVTETCQQQELLQAHQQRGRYPSLEVLVKYGLGFEGLNFIGFCAEEELGHVQHTLAVLGLPHSAPLRLCPELFPGAENYRPTTHVPLFDYFAACRDAQAVLPPPEIVFD